MKTVKICCNMCTNNLIDTLNINLRQHILILYPITSKSSQTPVSIPFQNLFQMHVMLPIIAISLPLHSDSVNNLLIQLFWPVNIPDTWRHCCVDRGLEEEEEGIRGQGEDGEEEAMEDKEGGSVDSLDLEWEGRGRRCRMRLLWRGLGRRRKGEMGEEKEDGEEKELTRRRLTNLSVTKIWHINYLLVFF